MPNHTLKLPMADRRVKDRKCGRCTLCCTAMGVPELAKPAGTPCQHLTPGGCGIYEDRPESCRVFECLWLMGEGDSTVRPDRTRAVPVAEDGGMDEPALVLYTLAEDREKWRKSKYLSRWIDRMVARGSGAFIVTGQDRKLITEPGSRLHRKLMALAEDFTG